MNLLTLVKELNETMQQEDNPIITSQDWNFHYSTDGDMELLGLHDNRILEGQGDSTKQDLEEIEKELETWIPALQSALWAVRKCLKN